MSIKVLFINYPYPFYNSGEERFDFNYGVGRLTAYLEQEFNDSIEVKIKWQVLKPSETFLSECKDWEPDIVGLSCFLWNHSSIIETVNALKNAAEKCLIVLGGPAANYLFKKYNGFGGHPVYAIKGGGEIPFAKFVKQYSEGKLTGQGEMEIENLIEYKNQSFIEHPPWLMNESLDFLPSPFLNAILQPAEKDIVMFLEASRGCNRKCAYCYAHSATLKCKTSRFSADYLVKELQWAVSNNVIFIDLLEVSIGRDIEWLTTLVDKVLEVDALKSLRFHFNLHPSELTPELVEQMERLGERVKHIVVGIQSMSALTAKTMRRHVNMKKLEETLEIYAPRLPLKVEFIAGLPGDTPASLESAILSMSKYPVGIVVNRLTLIPGTEYFEKMDEYQLEVDESKMFQIVQSPTFDREYLDTLRERLKNLLPGENNRIEYNENEM